MRGNDVRTPEDALAYVTDCTLATVCDMAMKKSRGKHEYRRQKSIAQKAIDWMVDMNVDFKSTRAREVCESFGGSVEHWAKSFEAGS